MADASRFPQLAFPFVRGSPEQTLDGDRKRVEALLQRGRRY